MRTNLVNGHIQPTHGGLQNMGEGILYGEELSNNQGSSVEQGNKYRIKLACLFV